MHQQSSARAVLPLMEHVWLAMYNCSIGAAYLCFHLSGPDASAVTSHAGTPQLSKLGLHSLIQIDCQWRMYRQLNPSRPCT